MDKMKKYLMMFAALVATTLGFTACSSEDDLASAEQGQEQERGVVKTQFTISIPQVTSGTTRMTADVVQNEGTLAQFRGITGIRLYPFSNQISGVPETTTIPSTITLFGPNSGSTGKFGPSGNGNNTIGGQGNLFTTSTSHLYQDVDIPIGTRSFMFYGVAPRGASSPTIDDNFVYGALSHNLDATTDAPTKLQDITFSPSIIYNKDDVDPTGTALAAYLTTIAAAQASTTNTWANTSNVGLAALYENFTSMKAGSWTSVKAAVQEMYINLKVRDTDNDDTKALKNAIRTAINNSTYVTSIDANDMITFNSSVANYPRNLNLPDGAAYIQWNAAGHPNAFTALANNRNTGLNTPTLKSYAYPASLYYRVLSNILTSSTIKGTSGDYAYTDTKTWATIKSYYKQTAEEAAAGYDNSYVSSKTRSIVVKDSIQYAVGRLDAKVRATAASLTDNSTTNSISVSDPNATSNIKITGILIGGQKSVNYLFAPKSGSTENITIYDADINGNPIYLKNYGESDTNIPINYTLVLETADATNLSDEDASIKIAVEFENNTQTTIVGKGNELIHPGCRFYLIGSLNPKSNTTQNYYGTTTPIKKAFVQAYTTTVILKVNNFNNAYHTLPDLTVPQLEMGLSVDLSWKPGISQEIDME